MEGEPSQTSSRIRTKILILSDTHGLTLDGLIPNQPVDVVIHCGDLTEESKLDECRTTIQLLRKITAPLKLVIAGNHDFTLDTAGFRKKVDEARPALDPELVRQAYGDYGEAKSLFDKEHRHGTHLLDEGMHHFVLDNGAELTVYASPYTPSLGDWAFQYRRGQGHSFDVEEGTDIVVTHGPPRGILDRTSGRERAGCPGLFAVVARVKPLLHCFGHIHEGWGARLVSWREKMSDCPSHLTDIDNERSTAIETLSTIHRGRFDDHATVAMKAERLNKYAEQKYCGTSHCSGDEKPLIRGEQTLFVNAAIQGDDEMPVHLPWLVELELPKTDEMARVARYLGQ